MFKKIMVPVDLAHVARLERALQVAADLARHVRFSPGPSIMTRKLAIIGDLFMLSRMFEQALLERCRLHDLDIRMHDFPWPDAPMEHGYAVKGMDGLKEYMGTADEVVELAGDAEMLVTHLAPLSADIMDRLPNLKFVAVSRGGPA